MVTFLMRQFRAAAPNRSPDTSDFRYGGYSSGTALDREIRSDMESRFGYDFSKVRIHSDTEAAASADRLEAQAYTIGKHIFFATGRYSPHSPRGQGLLAHELAHTIQQSNPNALVNAPRVVPEGAHIETNANAMARAGAVRGLMPSPVFMAPAVAKATRTFSLTFDDGPHAAALGSGKNRTENVLDALKSKGVTAGFFIQTAALDPEGHGMRGSTPVGKQLVQRMQADGHVVGIHTGGTKDHELHTTAEKAGRLQGELQSAKSYIKAQTGSEPTLVRPPTGAYNKDVLKTYASLGLTNELWDIDGDQGKNLKLAELKQRLTDGIKEVQSRKPPWKGSTPSDPKIVVLHHDIQAGTSQHIGELIEHIKAETKRISGGADDAAFAKP